MATAVLERRGSSKDIWKVLGHGGEVIDMYFVFSDRVSVFDVGPIPIPFTGLGQLRCAIAGRIFQALNSAGFLTHYISHDVSLARMHVQPVNIPALGISYGKSLQELMPVELLCRLALTKKFIGRIERGEVDRRRVERLLPSSEMRDGVRLDPPFVECSTKFEESDRYLRDDEAAVLIGIGHRHLLGYYDVVEKIFSFLYKYFRSNGGFLLMDGKIEASLSVFDRVMMVVDSISPDELRLIGHDARSYDKDPVREWYVKTFPEWYAELLTAKKLFPQEKSKWPTYPGVPPPAVIEDMVERYQMVAEAIGAI